MMALQGMEWPTSTGLLLSAMREALLALIPVAEKVHMSWRDDEAYDDWDAIATALYDSIVGQSILHSIDAKEMLPLAPYDLEVKSYKERSYIRVSKENPELVFVRFETKDNPFDTVGVAAIQQSGMVMDYKQISLQNVEFEAVIRKAKETVVLRNFTVLL